MSIKSKHSAGKTEKSGKWGKRKKMDESDDMESSEEELDLTKDCHPIGYYINDKAEMINQMFSVIKGNKLKAMLPPILKDCDLELLKLQCLDQLLGMSEKRIACILDGGNLESSSESDVESNDCESDGKNKRSSSSNSDRSEESMEVELTDEAEKRSKKKGKKKVNSVETKAGKTALNDVERPPAEQGKTLLEILELEMRARAIRALLKQNEGGQDGASVDSKPLESKENGLKVNEEVVDLTGCEDDESPATGKKETVEDNGKTPTTDECDTRDRDAEKAKRLQAELELRNKLFKKKVYRTRQQRMENDEYKESANEETVARLDEPHADDPEEGELSSSEDGASLEKQEGEKQAESDRPLGPVKGNVKPDTETMVLGNGTDAEEVGTCDDASQKQPLEDDVSDSRECPNTESEDDVLNIDSQEAANSLLEESKPLCGAEETSWRERWLRKDGVQKLVKSSKIYAKVKKRIAEKSQRSKEDVNASNEAKLEADPATSVEVIEGSIKEYEKLVGKSVQPTEEPGAEKLSEKDENEKE